MSDPRPSLEFRKTGETEPRPFRLYVALFPMGSGSLCHWGLVVKDGLGTTDLLDAGELGGARGRATRDFDGVRKTHLKILCEVADLGCDEGVRLVRAAAAAEEVPPANNGRDAFCRVWVVNVLKSLGARGGAGGGVGGVELYGEPEAIQRAVQRASGGFGMGYGPEYHIVAPPRNLDRYGM